MSTFCELLENSLIVKTGIVITNGTNNCGHYNFLLRERFDKPLYYLNTVIFTFTI